MRAALATRSRFFEPSGRPGPRLAGSKSAATVGASSAVAVGMGASAMSASSFMQLSSISSARRRHERQACRRRRSCNGPAKSARDTRTIFLYRSTAQTTRFSLRADFGFTDQCRDLVATVEAPVNAGREVIRPQYIHDRVGAVSITKTCPTARKLARVCKVVWVCGRRCRGLRWRDWIVFVECAHDLSPWAARIMLASWGNRFNADAISAASRRHGPAPRQRR